MKPAHRLCVGQMHKTYFKEFLCWYFTLLRQSPASCFLTVMPSYANWLLAVAHISTDRCKNGSLHRKANQHFPQMLTFFYKVIVHTCRTGFITHNITTGHVTSSHGCKSCEFSLCMISLSTHTQYCLRFDTGESTGMHIF